VCRKEDDRSADEVHVMLAVYVNKQEKSQCDVFLELESQCHIFSTANGAT
jgi:hypothetical protein